MNVMVDVETLSISLGAAVFEIALVPFSTKGVATGAQHLHVTFVPTSGQIDVDTVRWWLERADRCALRTATMSESDAAEWVYNYLSALDHQTMLWAMPASFDCVVLQQWLNRNGHQMPIGLRNWRDVRTVRELAGWPESPAREGHQSHNALHDCIRQIDTLVRCWEELRS